MRVVPASQGRGPTGIRPQAGGPGTCAWQSSPQRCRPSAGRHTSGAAHGSASAWPEANRPSRSSSPWRRKGVPCCGPWPSKGPGHRRPHDAGWCKHRLSKVAPAIGRDAAPVWCHPRRREETDRYARPSHAAGTRRRHVRWDPTHGEQREQPSGLPGSGSSESQKEHTRMRT